MGATGAGTAIMIAIAAALWFAYFVPTWMRRREYLDTERTATRLQQTLRVLAETAELPEQVRVEVSSRDAARQERLLRAERRRADALAELTAVSVRAASPAVVRRQMTTPAQRRRRRAHRFATMLMIAATVTIGIQLSLVVATGAVLGSWLVLSGGAILGITGVTVRRRIDRRTPQAPSIRRARAVIASMESAVETLKDPSKVSNPWTPVPVPSPLYLSQPESQSAQPTAQATSELAAQLRLASLASERALRAAHDSPEVSSLTRTAALLASEAPVARPEPSRWAAMGRLEVLDKADIGAPDLDEVLRRRRAAS